MGQRTVKRVPLDFDHPLEQVWPGFLSPEPRPCPAGRDCVHGWTAAGAFLNTVVRDLLLAGSQAAEAAQAEPRELRRNGRLWPHPYLTETLNRTPFPSSDLAELTTGLAGRPSSRPFGHDSLDSWSAAKAVVKAAGLDPEVWGVCPECQGSARHPDDSFDDWEETPPPEGEGWQLWETTSEGSPVSPVFASAEELAEWCGPNASVFADFKMSTAEWLTMFTDEDPACATEVASTMVFRAP